MLLDHSVLVRGLKRLVQLLYRFIALIVQVQIYASIMVQDERPDGVRPLDLQGVNQATLVERHLWRP